MNRASQAQEPSMEEILASIRRIISDDETAAAPNRPQAAAMVAQPASPPAPSPAPAPLAAVEPEDESAGNSQDDIDAMFASDAPAVQEPEPAAPEAAEADDIFDLTPEMKAPEPKEEIEDEDQPEATTGLAAGEAPIVEGQETDVMFRDPEPAAVEDDLPQVSAPRPPAATMEERDRLLSPMTDAAVSGAFSNLASLILSKDARTLEDLVKEMLRPLLKAWLDDNLPPLVERMVREEIERVSRGRR